MDHQSFRERFTDMGFHVEVEERFPDEDLAPVLVARNQNNDEVYWHVGADTEEWELYVDPQKFSLDDASFDPADVTFEDDGFVIDRASGTRNKDFGYGVAGFGGRMEVRKDATRVTETHTYE